MQRVHQYLQFDIYSTSNFKEVRRLFSRDNPKYVGFDTETTGLHIIKDRPFIVQLGWKKEHGGIVFVLDISKESLDLLKFIFESVGRVFAHNVKYDMHMLSNMGFNVLNKKIKWADSMFLARLSSEAISNREGGVSMQLESLAEKYVDKDAKHMCSIIKEELSSLKTERNTMLAAMLRTVATGEKTATGRTKFWTKGMVEDMLNDVMFHESDLPQEVRMFYDIWKREYPEPTYANIDRNIMHKYGGVDIVLMIKLIEVFKPIVKVRDQWNIFEMECKAIIPFWKMERTGYRIDREYLMESRDRTREYIVKKRKFMYETMGEVVNVGQHQKIKEKFKELFGVELQKDDKAALKKVIESDAPEQAKVLAKVIIELRTLEKWYSTYILRLLDSSEYDGRAYTQINQSGAISGRVSSDFQQFPKFPLLDDEGNELFSPRRAIIVSDGYKGMYYLDFSQIELREQANYTLLVSGGDLNLCRAYFPFKCKSKKTGETYDWKNREHTKRWNSGEWVDENGHPWKKTDVHSLTTHNALIALGYTCYERYTKYKWEKDGEPFFGKIIDESEFEKVRYRGKTFNFMRNYGGGTRSAMEQLGLPELVAKALVAGYSESFPDVELYQNGVIKAYKKRGYVNNPYGRRYYLKPHNWRRAYKLANYLIQGGCADQLKNVLIKINELLEKGGYKSRMVMVIHDEIQYEVVEGEEHLIDKFLEIMQYMDEKHFVPIVSDVEFTDTSWQDKFKLEYVAA
ncbi:DNA polymerase [Paenibacillus larvae]